MFHININIAYSKKIKKCLMFIQINYQQLMSGIFKQFGQFGLIFIYLNYTISYSIFNPKQCQYPRSCSHLWIYLVIMIDTCTLIHWLWVEQLFYSTRGKNYSLRVCSRVLFSVRFGLKIRNVRIVEYIFLSISKYFLITL